MVVFFFSFSFSNWLGIYYVFLLSVSNHCYLSAWSSSSGSKNVTMDVILRSSSRFKKAKLTASQSELNDTESQHVEFVPDSQANL